MQYGRTQYQDQSPFSFEISFEIKARKTDNVKISDYAMNTPSSYSSISQNFISFTINDLQNNYLWQTDEVHKIYKFYLKYWEYLTKFKGIISRVSAMFVTRIITFIFSKSREKYLSKKILYFLFVEGNTFLFKHQLSNFLHLKELYGKNNIFSMIQYR